MTSLDKSAGAILKSDTKGRMRTPLARRESLLDEFEKSGLSGTKSAELSGIKYQTFANWLQKRRQQNKSSVKPADPVRWLEAVVQEAKAPVSHEMSVVIVRLPGGAQIELADSKQLPLAAALLRALESHAEFFRRSESLCGGRSVRHAQRF